MFPKSLPEIKATRVALRRLNEADVDDIFAIYSDAETMKYWSTVPMKDPEQARELIQSIERYFDEKTLIEWGVSRLEDGAAIGTVTLSSLDLTHRRAEIGFALARSCWGRGYMKEALAATFDYAFGELGLGRIEADVDPDNAASLGLLERMGFQREGYLRERWRVGGGVQDTVMLGLLQREWNAGS
ncbi:MAG: GNAT family N-acetyltransferase [Myxococcota bacterium]